ncbi:MAG: AAA family ATPase [Candidatus Midichloria sp.]|nr:AAA family ATPase [Candidatus Midichloria sp.]
MNKLKGLFSGCGKGNSYREKVLFTGVFDTFKKELGSGLNDVRVYDMMSEEFKEDFGFLQSEVDELTTQFSDKNEETQIQQWYNSYSIPAGSVERVQVYNPKLLGK